MGLDLIAAAAEVQSDWLAAVARATGGRVWDEDGLPCRQTPADVAVVCPDAIDPDALDRVLAWCALHDLPRVGCWLAEEDAEAAAILRTNGFEEGWWPHWMALELAGVRLPEPNPRVAEVPHAHGERTSRFVVDGAGEAWLHAPGDVAGIFDVGVEPARRRQGLGTALTWAAVRRARELGCRAVVLNATADGEALYRALGFVSLGFGRTYWLHR